jgi:hypothetical protein
LIREEDSIDPEFRDVLHTLQKDFQSILDRIPETMDTEEEEAQLDQARIVLAK